MGIIIVIPSHISIYYKTVLDLTQIIKKKLENDSIMSNIREYICLKRLAKYMRIHLEIEGYKKREESNL